MEIQRKIRGIRTGLASLVLGASLAFNTQYASAGVDENGELLYGALAEIAKQAGDGEGASNWSHKKEHAELTTQLQEENKKTVESLRKSQANYSSELFFCNSWNDKNKNRRFDEEDEFGGVKSRFAKGEPLLVVGKFIGPGHCYLNVIDAEGKCIYRERIGDTIFNDIEMVGTRLEGGKPMMAALNKSGVGEYTIKLEVEWAAEPDRIQSRGKFEIYDPATEIQPVDKTYANNLARENAQLKEQLRLKTLQEENAQLKAQLETSKTEYKESEK